MLIRLVYQINGRKLISDQVTNYYCYVMETGDIVMEYYFAGELSENQCSLMRDSLAECWIKIDDQPAAPDLLSYIMV